MRRWLLIVVPLIAGCTTFTVPILEGVDNRFCEPTYRPIVMPGQDVAVCEPEETVEFLLCLRFAGLTSHGVVTRSPPRQAFSMEPQPKPAPATPGSEESLASPDAGATRAAVDTCIDRFKTQAAIFEPLRAAQRKAMAGAPPPQASTSAAVGP